ncbi:hypothetical protein CAAN1_13S03444 [[Candida] anglica]|uniref:C2H2-type domain-containing protein n=1 Tax=[Candida] anglica TaxID=148631 RepID=A0ABP0EHZ1_9ASCO
MMAYYYPDFNYVYGGHPGSTQAPTPANTRHSPPPPPPPPLYYYEAKQLPSIMVPPAEPHPSYYMQQQYAHPQGGPPQVPPQGGPPPPPPHQVPHSARYATSTTNPSLAQYSHDTSGSASVYSSPKSNSAHSSTSSGSGPGSGSGLGTSVRGTTTTSTFLPHSPVHSLEHQLKHKLPHPHAPSHPLAHAPPAFIHPYHHQQQQLHTPTNPYHTTPLSPKGIDYPSLVGYTVSPSLKRKRKSKGSIVPDSPEQSFPCPQCDKVFQKPYNLKSHMRTHSDDKPYTCNHCDRRFARSHDKKRHEALHNGEKNFRCEGYLKDGCTKWGCGKKFARSDALSRHFRTETGWLCIKPLMDEAKESDRSPHGGAPPFGPGSELNTSYVPLLKMEPSMNGGSISLMENSNFIRKMVQNKYV